MTSGATGQRPSSVYAPLDPESALPPGLDERVVANSYKATGVLPKRVLLELGIRRYNETAAIRLRKALDDPDARARLSRPISKVRSLHQAIYALLINQPAYRSVYKRLVKPSELVRRESGRPRVTELNPVEFEARVTADQLDCSWSDREVGSQSDEEGLALFALAYGLLQPGDAPRILAPILAIGASFREFFGVTGDVSLLTIAEAEVIDKPHQEDVRDAVSGGPTQPVSAIHAIQDVVSPEETRGPSQQAVVPYRGRRTQSVRKAIRTLQAHRATRKSLGMADLLDESAFKAARDLELVALADIEKLDQVLRNQWESTSLHYAALAQDFGVRLSMGACPSGLENIAASLDDLESDGAELLRLVAALKSNSAKAQAVGASLARASLHKGAPVDLPGAIESLKQQLAAATASTEQAQQWKDKRRVLQEKLGDCAGVRPATSLETIEPDDVTALLEYSLVNSDWDTLRPLLFRLWSERFAWSGPAASTIAEVLDQALGAAASNGDLDRHTEQLSYLERGTLQDLLGLPNPSLVRHVVFATFRESLARRHSLFLTAIWGFERAWTTRASTVGDRLQRFFSILYQCFIRSRSAPRAMSFLARADATEEGDSSCGIETTIQDAKDVATLLEEAGHVPGLFGRLRFWSMTHYFMAVASAVREQRREDVVKLLKPLQRRFRSGELAKEVFEAVASRNTRAVHRESLTRYLDDQIALVTSWLSRTAPESEIQHDAALGMESLELQRLASQLARGRTRAGDISPGSVSWLEKEIGRLIARLREGDILVPSPIWLGEGTLQPLPTQVRSWAAYTEGSLGWRDLLQDQLAEQLLGVRRALLETVRDLSAEGYLDAAVEAAKVADSDDQEVGSALEALQELKTWRDNQTADIETLYARLDTLERGANREQRNRISSVKSDLLIALEEVDGPDRNETQSAVDSCRKGVKELERQISAGLSHRRALEDWLVAAGITPPQGASLERLESLMGDARDAAVSRRVHLLRLQALDAAPTPAVLREAVRVVVSAEDAPDNWPSAERASDAELYIDNFTDQSERWWSAAEHVDRADITFRRIAALAAVFAKHLHNEVRALTSGQPEEALLLTLLTERAKWSIPAIVDRVAAFDARTSSDGSTLLSAKIGEVAVAEEQITMAPGVSLVDAPAFIAKWRDRLRNSELDSTGDGRSVERTFENFRDGRYENVLRDAPPAWRWAAAQQTTRDLEALVAVYAWAHAESSGNVDTPERIEALALVLREESRLLERVPSQQDSEVSWMAAVLAGTPVTEVPPAGITPVILRMADGPPGSAERERLGLLLRMADASTVAQRIWDHFRGSTEPAKARTALLLLLFDLADNQPLHHLFVFAGENQKYLIAFTSLAKRALAEPSTRLLGAIQQTLVRLSTMKERPFRDYAQRIAGRLRYATGRVEVHVSTDLERDPQKLDTYRLPVTLTPDEGDPPIQLSISLMPSADYTLIDEPERGSITTDGVLLDSRVVEFHIRPHSKATACALAFGIKGETASGQLIDRIHRQEVVFGPDQELQMISRDDLLEIYTGYDAKPVRGAAFVGREQELAALEQALARPDPGAILIYGVRRLGKTSLLDEVRRRHCLTHRPGSRTLFLSVPVDQLSVAGSSKPFLDQFLQHIRHSVLWEDKNELFRQVLLERGVSMRALTEAGRQDEELGDAPFLIKLRVYIQSLLELCPRHVEVDSVVLVFDEFDKLLEEYRRGLRAEVEELTNQLRHAATEEQGLGIVLAGSDLMRSILGHYRNALFGSARIVSLECFDADAHIKEARKIIAPESLRNRRVFTDDGLRQVVDICGGHPLYMRLLACAAVERSRTRRISGGTVRATVPALLDNAVFPGLFPDVAGTVRQQLQCLNLMDPARRSLAELFLLVLARYSSLERPCVASSVLERDDRLLNLRQAKIWLDIRNELLELKVIRHEERGWRFRFPILGEVLRATFEYEFDRLATGIAAASVSPT